MASLADMVAAAPQAQKKQKVSHAVNMGKDPFQAIAERLHAIRQWMLDNNKSDGNIEIEAKLGMIVNSDYQGRVGPFTPGAGAVEILAAQMNKNMKFVSGVEEKDFEACHRVLRAGGGGAEKSHRKDYKYANGRKQVDEATGDVVMEHKTKTLESQFHLPSCPYDFRITVSIEKDMTPEEAEQLAKIEGQWETCRSKHRTSYKGTRLPKNLVSLWQADLTRVDTSQNGHPAPDAETVFEVELELSAPATAAWFGADDPKKETMRVAWDLWERIEQMMPREQTCSSLIEIKDDAFHELASRVVAAPWGSSGDNSGSFPGTLPVGFGRRMISKVQKESYMVSEKTDGVRHLLAVVETRDKAKHAILIDRKMRLFQLPGMEELGKAFGVGTVIDGEVVRNRSWKRDIFMCFDLLHDGTQSVVMKLFQQRLENLTTLLSKSYLRHLMEKKEELCGEMKTLPIILKHFYPSHLVGQVVQHIHFEGPDRVYLEKGPNGEPAPARKRHHKSDGLIFAPNTVYCRGTDFNYLKWKWHDMITLDFEVRWGGQYAHGMQVEFAGNGPDLVDFTEHVAFSPHALYRLRGDMAMRNSLIGEFEYCPEEGAFLYKLPRPDKKKSNYSRTVLSTLMEIAEGMDVEEVSYRLSFKKGEGDDWEKRLKEMRVKLLASRASHSHH